MINFADITKGVKSLFDDNLNGFIIERNSLENLDENTASKNKGWIGIFKGPVDYLAGRIGSIPWDVEIKVIVEVQCASFKSGEDAEDKLEEAIKEIMDLLNNNPKLGDTVNMTTGYEVEYLYDKNEEKSLFLQAAIIAILAEVQI